MSQYRKNYCSLYVIYVLVFKFFNCGVESIRDRNVSSTEQQKFFGILGKQDRQKEISLLINHILMSFYKLVSIDTLYLPVHAVFA